MEEAGDKAALSHTSRSTRSPYDRDKTQHLPNRCPSNSMRKFLHYIINEKYHGV